MGTRHVSGMLLTGLALLLLATPAWGLPEPPDAIELERGFRQPPISARPWVYWFWLNGNITKEGITADLEAMRKVGIGGVLIMEVDQGAPVGPVDFMSAAWRDLFKHAVSEAERLGLEVNMNNDAGWNGSGGPWIKPHESMQKVVWTETDVAGPKRLEATLSQPQAVAGYYRDIAVLAVPTPGAYRIEHIAVKACYEMGAGSIPVVRQEPPDEMVIDRKRIADISQHMDKSGRLTWDVPEGKWTILRFGHTSTGVENAPAPATGRGLECDKLSKEGIEANFRGMMARLIADNVPKPGSDRTLVATHIDSWENGTQNWTRRMREEFQQRRRYDLLPFLPVLTGRVVGGLEISERFLWDLRQTVSDLIVENYAGHMHTLASQNGLRLSIEGYYAPCHELTYVARADEPMGEFWMGGGAMETLKHMASAAHTAGKPILGAEAFTAGDRERWLHHPGSIKTLGDRAFCDGVNRFVFHRYAMQPWLDPKPGMTMGPWGLHYERTNTWWDWSAPWHEYLARCQFMLRQGRFVADLCFLQPELAPLSSWRHAPTSYDYDDCSPELVMTQMRVEGGRLVLPGGMSYRLLVLPEVPTMTPALLRKIRELVEAGATVVGTRPVQSPSLEGHPECDEELRRLAQDVWGDCDGTSVTQRRLGEGRVVCGVEPDKVLAQAGVQPDFTGFGLRYIHRAVGDADVYFVANPRTVRTETVCTFRVGGKVPQLWRPETGRTEFAPAFAETHGMTRVLLALGPAESVFVVFRKSEARIDPAVSMTRDGKHVWSLRDPPPALKVKSARYGVLGDPARTRDVREKAQRVIDRGELSFQVARMAEGDDPAYGTVKTLILEYEVDGKSFTVRGQDPETVHLTGRTARIAVQSARYGVLGDDKRTRDVTAKVQRLVDRGQSAIEVTEMARGDDPAFGVVKTLSIAYTVDGKPAATEGSDGETIELTPPAGSELLVRMQWRPDGLHVHAWQRGRYEITTASGKVHRVDASELPEAVAVGGDWKVEFPAESGAPPSVMLPELVSLSGHAEPGVKYFSGIATYTKKFHIPPELLGERRRLFLDLGRVQVMADVKVNGKPLGVEWKVPYVVDVTSVVKPGENEMEIRVANLWINRMIGDEQLPEDSNRNPNGTLKEWPKWLAEGKPSPSGRITFTSWRLWSKEEPLPASGLIGPVVLRPVSINTVRE